MVFFLESTHFLEKLHATMCNVTCNKEVIDIAKESRADYFRERRKNTKAFHVEVDREKMEQFEKKLLAQNKTKKSWLDEKINEELKK